MSQIFLRIINMSISASYIVLAVSLLRLLLKKAPKWITLILWGIVAVRLVCPFSIESVFSLIPNAETVSPDIMMDGTPEINTGIPIVNQVINPVISDSFASDTATSANPLQLWISIFALIWILGMVALLIYTVISYSKVKHKIGTAVLYKDNIYQSENVVSPFVLGLIKPKIYLPFNMNEKDMEHVVAHEMAHIRRKDHFWKPLGFLLLTIHWFNPLMWLGYALLCRDIELACDEKVIKELDRDARADYSQALLTCSVNRRIIAACPVAFGEIGVKDRVRSVLSYKKPAFWIIIVAVVVCIVIAVCFLTNPPSDETNPPSDETNSQFDDESDGVNPSGEIFTDYDGVYVALKSIDKNTGGHTVFNLVWHNETSKEVIYGESYFIERQEGNEWINTASSELAFAANGLLLRPNSTANKAYSTQRFDISKSGNYRLRVSFFVDEGDGDRRYKECNTWIEFKVGSIPDTESLRAKYPHFFGLNAEDGLTVYIWQFAKSHYGCYLTSTDQSFSFENVSFGNGGCSIDEMRAILSTYDIKREKIVLCPVGHPASSYIYVIDEAYRQNLENVFWSSFLPVEYNLIIDTVTFDVDNDGVNEICAMIPGETSGVFTFRFVVWEVGKEELEYNTLINSQFYYLSFERETDGITRVKAVTQGDTPETHYFDISIKNGHVHLTENGKPIGKILVIP